MSARVEFLVIHVNHAWSYVSEPQFYSRNCEWVWIRKKYSWASVRKSNSIKGPIKGPYKNCFTYVYNSWFFITQISQKLYWTHKQILIVRMVFDLLTSENDFLWLWSILLISSPFSCCLVFEYISKTRFVIKCTKLLKVK